MWSTRVWLFNLFTGVNAHGWVLSSFNVLSVCLCSVICTVDVRIRAVVSSVHLYADPLITYVDLSSVLLNHFFSSLPLSSSSSCHSLLSSSFPEFPTSYAVADDSVNEDTRKMEGISKERRERREEPLNIVPQANECKTMRIIQALEHIGDKMKKEIQAESDKTATLKWEERTKQMIKSIQEKWQHNTSWCDSSLSFLSFLHYAFRSVSRLAKHHSSGSSELLSLSLTLCSTILREGYSSENDSFSPFSLCSTSSSPLAQSALYGLLKPHLSFSTSPFYKMINATLLPTVLSDDSAIVNPSPLTYEFYLRSTYAMPPPCLVALHSGINEVIDI